ncbi:putative MFS transporter superfamily [Helianthus annuus]|nr:putative MFS transporter superfamily [Helianthus annuus]
MEVTPLSFGVRGWTFCPSLDTMIPVFYWKDHFFIYNHCLLFVIGFSRSLTRNAFVSILTWYFASNGDDVVKSAILSNAFDLISSIFVIFMAYLADSFIGRFQTLLFSNIAYIGLILLLGFMDSRTNICPFLPVLIENRLVSLIEDLSCGAI